MTNYQCPCETGTKTIQRSLGWDSERGCHRGYAAPEEVPCDFCDGTGVVDETLVHRRPVGRFEVGLAAGEVCQSGFAIGG